MNLATLRSRVAAAFFAAVFAASSASAALLATNNFETAYDGFSVASGDLSSLVSIEAYEVGGQPSATAPTPFTDFGENFLRLDADDSTVWRSFGTMSSDVYFDSYVQMEPSRGAVSWSSDAKLVVFLDAETNLCVVSGTAADDRTAVTNVLVATVEADSWHRLTIKAATGDVYSFSVYLDGTPLSTAGDVSVFYSLTDGASVSDIGFMGSGAIDDLVVRTTLPMFNGAAAFVNGEEYATLEEAVAAANGEMVTLVADHAATIAVSSVGTYAFRLNSHTFGGIVAGSEYAVAYSTSGGVTTYVVSDLSPAATPAAVWDCAIAGRGLDTVQGGFTLNKGVGGNYFSDGKLVITNNNSGYGGGYIALGSEHTSVSVLVKYSNFSPISGRTYPCALATIRDTNNRETGVRARNGDTALRFFTVPASGGVYNEVAGPENPTESGYFLFSYGVQSGKGAHLCLGESLARMETSSSSSHRFGGTLTHVSFGGPYNWENNDGWPDLVIEKVALFTNQFLTASDVAAFQFPSVLASEVNAKFGSATEVDLSVADGTVIVCDTAFNATNVNVICNGSVTLRPSAGNTTTFNFSGVTGTPVIAYEGAIPTVEGDTFTSTSVPTYVTDPEQWKGTIWLKNITGITGSNFLPNSLGNTNSTLRLTGISGWLWNGSTDETGTIKPAIELDDDDAGVALVLNNGYSYGGGSPSVPSRTVFTELKGSGTLVGCGSAPFVLLNMRKWDDFTGTLSLTNKIVCFGSTIPGTDAFTEANGGRSGGIVWISPGVDIDIPSSSTWHAQNTKFGGVIVEGSLTYNSLSRLSDATTRVVLKDTGVMRVAGKEAEWFAKDFSKVSGTGTVSMTPTTSDNWIGMPTNNFASTLGIEITQGSLVVPPDPGNTSYATNVFVIGGLSGAGGIQGNWGSYYAYRKLRICQSSDATWSGSINADSNNRLYAFAVAPGANSSTGTLTIAGNNTNKSTELEVEAGGKVNITGTWKGPVTVAGTLGGDGAITGNLALTDGAKLNSNSLAVSGSVTLTGQIAIDLPIGTDLSQRTTIFSAQSLDDSGATYTVTVGGAAVGSNVTVRKRGRGKLVVSETPGAILRLQ